MKIPICISILALILSCSTSKPSVSTTTKSNSTNSDTRYGYSESNPIKVGGVSEGPTREREYLSSLSGPNGELVWYVRQGSCCPFDTENSPFGGGMLDKYSVTYEGKSDTVTLYLNMYDEDVLYAPDDFKFLY